MVVIKIQKKIDVIAMAQKCIALIDTTQMSTTYKPATFMALLTVIAQHVDVDGRPPKTVIAADLGREVMRLFWYQALPYQGGAPLKQAAGKGDIVTAISEYRVKHHLRSPITTLDQAKSADASGIEKLESQCIKTVANYPVKLLQRFGEGARAREDLFLYEISWRGSLKVSQFEKAHLILKPGVGEGLLLLAPLLRTQLENQWIAYVTERNKERLPKASVTKYLFGAVRSNVAAFAKYLVALQAGRCFYCGGAITAGRAHVDHVVPWSISQDDGLDNLVATCVGCNLSKSATLIGLGHLKTWCARLVIGTPENLAVEKLAKAKGISRNTVRTRNIARAAYQNAPPGTTVWNSGGVMKPLDAKASLNLIR